MKLLLIETATDICSVAISIDSQIVAYLESEKVLSHSAILTHQIESCCQTAGISLRDIDAVGISQGPGSYTSLRVGAATAKGICYALDKPLVAVSTLQALARGCQLQWPDAWYVPMLDARRDEVWLALYDAQLREIAPAQPLIIEHNMLEEWLGQYLPENNNKGIILSGNGAFKQKSDIFSKSLINKSGIYSKASYLCALIEKKLSDQQVEDIVYFSPHYLKPPNITNSKK